MEKGDRWREKARSLLRRRKIEFFNKVAEWPNENEDAMEALYAPIQAFSHTHSGCGEFVWISDSLVGRLLGILGRHNLIIHWV